MASLLVNTLLLKILVSSFESIHFKTINDRILVTMSVRQALIVGGSRGIGFSVALKFAVFFLTFIYF